MLAAEATAPAARPASRLVHGTRSECGMRGCTAVVQDFRSGALPRSPGRRRSLVAIADSNIHWAPAEDANGTGVLVLSGSSGRVDVGRADMLAARGVTALALRWFGGDAQPMVPCEIPLETFTEAIDLLAVGCERIVLMGLSYGAEAALLTATVDDRVDAIVALAPTDVAWEGHHEHDDDPRHSKWTHKGQPVAFVPLDRAWEPPSTMPAFAELYEHSRDLAGSDAVEAATIPVEKFRGELVLVAGGDDKVWPSSQAAANISARRSRSGLATVVIDDPRAGHPIVLPGETPSNLSRPYQVGGDEDAPQRLGALAWPAIRRVLRLEGDD